MDILQGCPAGPCMFPNKDSTALWTYYRSVLLDHVCSIMMTVHYCGPNTIGPCMSSTEDGTVLWTYYRAVLLDHVCSIMMTVHYCGPTTIGLSFRTMYVLYWGWYSTVDILQGCPPGPCIFSNYDGYMVVWTYYWALLLDHVWSLIMTVHYCGHTTGLSCWTMYVP